MNSKKIPLVYDISVLGIGSVDVKSRTGVFRVIESLFDELKTRSDIELYPSLLPEYKNLINSYFLSLSEKEHRKNGLGFLKSVPPLKSFFDRFINIPEAEKGFSTYTYGEVEQTVPAGVYHSPWFPIPDQVVKNGNYSNFLTVHDLIPILFPQFFEKDNVDQFVRNIKSINESTYVICNSESTRSDLLNYLGHVKPEHVFVTHWAASSLFYQVKDERLIQKVKQKYKIPEGPYLLSASTLEPRKNIDLLIKAFQLFIKQEQNQDLNLVLVGSEGWKFDSIFKISKSDSSLQNRVFFTGYVEDKDLAPIYSGARGFVYPSFYEGFGLPPLEAMQCGVPVITSNTSSLPEVVGEAGILFDPLNIEELAQAIHVFATDSKARDDFRKKAVERAKQFSWSRCADQTISAYLCAIERR